MAQYDAFINLQINKKGQAALDKLENQINRITGRKQTGSGRTRGSGGSKSTTAAEIKLEANKKRQADRTIATKKISRRLGEEINRLEKANLNVDKLRARQKQAILNAEKGRIEAARADNKFLKDDINLLQKKLKAEKAIVNQRQLANPIDLRDRQKSIRSKFQSRIDLIEARGGNVGRLRQQMGRITDASNRPAFRNPFTGDVIKGAIQPGSLEKLNREMDSLIKKEEFKLKIDREQAKQAERELKANQKLAQANLPASATAPTGAFSDIASRRSFDRQGSRTFLNNRFAKTMQGLGAKKGFDVQSALISGAFPLLFGQGPLTAAAGAVGGGVGGMFGSMGGFAGGLAATAAVSAIQQAIAGIGKLGQALNPFTADIGQLTKSLGLAGTAEGQRIKLIETLSGKQAALTEATRVLSRQVGEAGAKSIKALGEKFQSIGNSVSKIFTKLGSIFATLLNPLIGLVDSLLKLTDTVLGRITRFFNNIFNRGKNADLTIPVSPTNSQQIDALFTGQFKSASEEITFLQDSIRLGSEQAEIKKKVFEFSEKIKEVTKDMSDKEKEALLRNQQKLANHLEEINLLKRQAELFENIRSTIADGMVNAIDALIDKTKSLNDVLGSVLKQIGRAFLSAGINTLVGNISFGGPKTTTVGDLPKVATAAQGAFFGNGIRPFSTGGITTRPTLGLIGEAGEDEYVIPASKMSSAMQRYSAGARGESVIPGTGSSQSVGGAGSSTVVNYMGPTLNFNGDEYVPRSAVGDIIATATARGAAIGESRTISSLKNSRGRRASLGL